MTPQTTPTPLFTSKLEQRVAFFFVAVGVIAITYGILYVVDFLPEKPSAEIADEVVATPEDVDVPVSEMPSLGGPDVAVANPLPVRVIFDSLDRTVPVLNPESASVEALDSALLNGVVRHPDSADFENTGTMFLLGHSSHLPVVQNRNFQAFNDIEDLEWGDTIRVQSADTEYVYRVDRVYEAKASAAEVPLQFEEARLVLVTCNTFGAKEDRFIVEARLVETKAL